MVDCVVNASAGWWGEELPELKVLSVDRLTKGGSDSVLVFVRPYGEEYEYGALCRSVSLTDVPPMAIANVSHGEWHSLGEFQILPRTALQYIETLRLTGASPSGDSLQLFSPFAGFLGSGLVLFDAFFRGTTQILQLFSPLRVMQGHTEIVVNCVPVWKIGVDIEAWMRLQWSTRELILGSIGRWVDDFPVYASPSPYAATPVSGVQRWTEGAWVNAGLNRQWFYAEADAIRINQIVVEVVPKGGVTYLNLHQVPRWVREALVQGRAPNQVVMTRVRARPRHISDISAEVRVEVRA
jgi:hypothetical protein